MSTEAQTPSRERWRVTMTSTGGSTYQAFVVIDYDHRGVTEITREALSGLMLKAGAERVSLDEPVA